MGLGESSSHKTSSSEARGDPEGQVATWPMAETPKAEEELLALSTRAEHTQPTF